MNVLIAEDDAASRKLLETLVRKWGHEPLAAANGAEAWAFCSGGTLPPMMLLDWLMPDMEGIELCRRVRALPPGPLTPYVIMVTALDEKERVVRALDAGADDYLVKPYDQAELRARVRAGERILALQESLSARIRELTETREHVRTLQGIIPICMHCHRIRNDADVWQRLESYFAQHSEVLFSHGLCPECRSKHYGPSR